VRLRRIPGKEFTMLARTVLGAVCASALAAGVLAPTAASAGGGGGFDELEVRVCKYTDSNEEFDFRAWTDEERRRFSLEDDECKRVYLDYSRNRFWLREYIDEDEWRVRFRVRGDYEDYETDEDRVKVWFDDNEDEPYLRINVYNYER
jgi:hypothetical protein